jgi:hypothetical protein
MMNKTFSILAAGLIAFQAQATPITFTGTSGTHAASVTFSASGANLLVTLSNTSASDVLLPVEVLTGVFFTIAGDPALTRVSALLPSGASVLFGSSGGGNVGGEWAYVNHLSGAPGGANEGISSAGLGLFGAGNFGGVNLQGPLSVNGLQYGITSAGDNGATGNTPVTGTNALIKNSVDFVLSGLPDGFDPALAISDVSFQYGTALTEPNVPGVVVVTGGGPTPQDAPYLPAPGSLALLGLGFVALGLTRRRQPA